MRKILMSFAFCTAALSASAQCAVPAQAPTEHQVVPAQAAPAHPDKSPGWLSSARAGSAHLPVHFAGTRAIQDTQGSSPGQEHRHHTRPAMLFAALAVMIAIALRRLGASDT